MTALDWTGLPAAAQRLRHLSHLLLLLHLRRQLPLAAVAAAVVVAVAVAVSFDYFVVVVVAACFFFFLPCLPPSASAPTAASCVPGPLGAGV